MRAPSSPSTRPSTAASSWRPSKRGLLTPPRTDRDKGWVTALAVDPANTNIVYAGSDRVSKSTDGGHSWKTVFPPHPTRYPADHVSALAIAPTRPETIYAITADFGQSVVDTRKRTHHDLQVDRRRHDLAGKHSRSRGCRPDSTRRRSATSDHRLRGHQCEGPENDQRRQNLAADRRRPPDHTYPRTLPLPFPRGRQRAGGRPTPQRHRLRSPDPGRHLQDHQRRTRPGSAPSTCRPQLRSRSTPHARRRSTPQARANADRQRIRVQHLHRWLSPGSSGAPTAAAPGPPPPSDP